MKTDKNFKLSKTAKRMIALSGGTAESRNQLKRMFIDAEASEANAKLAKLREKSKD